MFANRYVTVESSVAAPVALSFNTQNQVNEVTDTSRKIKRKRVGNNMFKTPSPLSSPDTDASTIVESPSTSAQKTINMEDMEEINPHDSFDDVCDKLGEIGWTINIYQESYYSPNLGYHDVKRNPELRDTKCFLSKASFLGFLKKTFGWEEEKPKEKKTRKAKSGPSPRKKKRSGSNAVTPNSWTPMRRSLRTRSFCDDESVASKVSKKPLTFKSEDEEAFYIFANLMPQLKAELGWTYTRGRIDAWNYVLPGGKSEAKGGKHNEDYFHQESEVIKYCMEKKYYERRVELRLN